MYEVLVTDDEKIIADGLCEMLQKELGDIIKVHSAYSGKQAVNICGDTRIDLLVTDVRMPEMDGFELKEKICEKWPKCIVIFLSAYSDFNYVQNAIRSNGVDYVVKTEGDEKIVSSVKKAIGILDVGNRHERMLEQAKMRMEKALPLLRKRYILDLIEGCAEAVPELIGEQFHELGIQLDSNAPVLILMGRFDIWKEQITKSLEDVYFVCNILEEHLSTMGVALSIDSDSDEILCLVQSTEDSQFPVINDEFVNAVHKVLENAQKSFEEILGGVVLFSLYPRPVEWVNLSETFYMMKYDPDRYLEYEYSPILVHEIDDSNEDLASFKVRQACILRSQINRIAKLGILLERGRESEFVKSFNALIDGIKHCRKISYKLIEEVYYTFALMFLSHINRAGIIMTISEKINIDLLMRMENHPSWQMAIKYFETLANAIFRLGTKGNGEKVEKVFCDIENYVAENLDGNISLYKIAEILHYNPWHLSRLFKQITGKSLTEYTTEVRLKEACALLSEGEHKMYEIASMVGFDNPSSFNRCFKKHFGVTPQMYRERVSEQRS